MEKMYRGITNSPKTELVALISETDTEIEVADSSVLLASEGVAVIGNGDVAETIKYTEVDGNILKGCIRGYEGVARSWIAGTRIARNFTAGDWNAAIDNIEGLYDRVDNDEVDPLTLQPGLQVVTAAKDARFKLGEIRGKTEINGQGRIGIIGVENPYAIGISRNLLPPFYEWTLGGLGKIKSPYKLETTTTLSSDASYFQVKVLPNTTYTYTSRVNGRTSLFERDSSGTLVATPYSTTENENRDVTVTFVTSANTEYVGVYATNTGAGTFTLENPMLVIGEVAMPFEPQRKSLLAFQTELHANPEDGSDPDVLFEQDGEYRKLEKWKKVVANGSLKFMFVTSLEGFKVVYVSGSAANAVGQGDNDDAGNLFGTKFNGQTLVVDDTPVYSWPSADLIRLSSTNIYLSISNKDSGWSDDYIPTQEEIKAYFDGYKMYPYGDAAGAAAPYNGTGTKGWCYRIDGVTGNENSDFTGGTSTLPTTRAPNWSPYSLLYRLAKETVEPATVEGCLNLNEGDNMVEVGRGIVLRERANPQYYSTGNNWFVNNGVPGWEATHFRNRAHKILSIYKNSRKDPNWLIETSSLAYGNDRAYISNADYEQSAAYSVTYLKLDKSPIAPISGSLAANEKAQISDLSAGVAEALHGVSVLQMQKAEKDAPSPQWIYPTLLNGWVNYSGNPDEAVRYKKIGSVVYIVGTIKSGAIGSSVFTLPVGYRPKGARYFNAVTNDGSGNVVGTLGVSSASGDVIITTGGNNYVYLNQVSFLVE